MNIAERISQLRVIPVVKIDSVDQALPLASALKEGGLPLAEITLRTDVALEAISVIRKLEGFGLGAGTVLNVEQAKKAIEAGATFIVSPGLDNDVVEYCQSQNTLVFPGVATPTEVQRAYNLGIRIAKFFPAVAAGGIPMLKSLAGPFHQMHFVPTGGIDQDNLDDYLSLSCVHAVGGSWMVKADWIQNGEFDRVAETASAAIRQVSG